MRWVFAVLLISNAFYAFWHFTAVAPARPLEPPLPANVASLDLLSERQPVVVEGGSNSTEPADLELAPVVPVDSDLARCWVLGPVAEKSDADRLRGELGLVGLRIEVEAATVEREPDYWVHVGPFESRERASAVLRDLRGKNVDSFLIVDGELTNAVSLGLFSQQERALRLQRERAGLGYEVRIYHIPREREVWNLRVSVVDGADPGPAQQRLRTLANSADIDKKICN